jgi:hypothetical protein
MQEQEQKRARRILCPLCAQGMQLDAFTITEHEDQTWSADPCVICPTCGAHFSIRLSRAYFCACKPAPPDAEQKTRRK